MNNPKISIVTVCLNSAKTIARTIESVQDQTYKNIEHVFVDGRSEDDTVAIIRMMAPQAKLLSEKDHGIYEAMNKGYGMATGDIIGILNSDDYFLHARVLEDIAACFMKNDIDYVCGRIKFFTPATGNFSHFFGREPSLRENLVRMSMAHPTIYIKREIINTHGPYDVSYRIAADFDWCLRLLRSNYRYCFLTEPMVAVSLAGCSAQNHVVSAREEMAVKIKYYPGQKWRFRLVYGYCAASRLVRDLLISLGLGRLVQIARQVQGKTGIKD